MKLNDLVEFLERMREESVKFHGIDNPEVTFYHYHINDQDVAAQTLEFKTVESAALTGDGELDIEL